MLLRIIKRGCLLNSSLLLLLIGIIVGRVNIGMGGGDLDRNRILVLGVLAGLLILVAVEGIHEKSWVIKWNLACMLKLIWSLEINVHLNIIGFSLFFTFKGNRFKWTKGMFRNFIYSFCVKFYNFLYFLIIEHVLNIIA